MSRLSNWMLENYGVFRDVCPHIEKGYDEILTVLRQQNVDRLKILDIGAGDGLLAERILQELPKCRITTVDCAPVMVIAQEVRLAPYKNCSLVTSDALEYLTSYDGDKYNCIISSLVFHNFDGIYRGKCLREVYRLLKPEGELLLFDKIASSKKEHVKNLAWQIIDLIERLKILGQDHLATLWVEHYLEDESDKYRIDEAVITKTLQKAGFTSVSLGYRHKMEALLVCSK